MATTDTTLRFVRNSDYTFSATLLRGADPIDLAGATLFAHAGFNLADSFGVGVGRFEALRGGGEAEDLARLFDC